MTFRKTAELFLFLLTIHSMAYSQNYEWGRKVTQTSGPYPQVANGMVVDSLGNVLTVGHFQSTVDFDPGTGTSWLASSGSMDGFIMQLDANGNFQGALRFGGSSYDKGIDIALDPSGNILIVGVFSGTADMNPGTGVQNITSNGQEDVFILKLDPNGAFLWVKNIGGVGNDSGNSIFADPLGNVFVTGSFNNSIDLNPGTGTDLHTSLGYEDLFLIKLDENGNYVYGSQIGGSSSDIGNEVRIDGVGNTLVTGEFSGMVDFNPGTATYSINSTMDNSFIMKLDPNGNFLWANAIGVTNGFSNISMVSMEIDNSNNCILSGSFDGNIGIALSDGSNITLVAAGIGPDVLTLKVDSNGDVIWAKQFAGTGSPSGGQFEGFGKDVFINDSSEVLVTGLFEGTTDFDPNSGILEMTSNNETDAFLTKLSSNGEFIWAKKFGGNLSDEGTAVGGDSFGGIYLNGSFYGDIDLNPGTNVDLYTAGGWDFFVVKLGQCSPNIVYDVNNACETFTWINGTTYTTSNNIARVYYNTPNGCDSIVQLDLTINTNEVVDSIVACYSYTWIDGITYTSSNNTAMHTLTNMYGCDSIIHLNLNIGPFDIVDSYISCQSITWIDGNTYTTSNNTATHALTSIFGCDSTIHLDFTYTPVYGLDTQLSCDSLLWIDGNIYSSNNNSATWVLNSLSGCDSIVTLNLTINTVNTNSTIINDTIISANETGAIYQWLDCNNNYSEIFGETNQEFNLTANGYYSFRIESNGCIDTSECILIDYMGFDDLDNQNVLIYPNPSFNFLEIQLKNPTEHLTTKIVDFYGKVCYVQQDTGSANIILNTNLSPGVYWLELVSENWREKLKIIIH